jgi:hypothetical protein
MATGSRTAPQGGLGTGLGAVLGRAPALAPGLTAAAWGVLLGRAALLDGVAPFGFAFVAAVRRADARRAAWAAAGVTAGMALRAPVDGMWGAALALGLLLAVGALDDRPAAARWGAVAAGLAGALAALAVSQAGPELPVAPLLSGLMAAALCGPYGQAVRFLTARPAPRLSLDGPQGAGAVLLLAGAAAAAAPLRPWGAPLALALAALSAQGAGRMAGTGVAAVTALGVGGVGVLAGGLTPAGALMAAAGGVLSAWARRQGPAWGATGAVAGGLLFAPALGPATPALFAGLGAYMAGTLAAWAAPAAVWDLAAAYLGLAPVRPDRALRRRLRDLSRAVGLISAAVGESAAAAPEPAKVDRGERRVEGVARRACGGCSLYTRCWEREAARTHLRLTEALVRLEGEGQGSAEEALRTWCLRPRPVAIALGYARDLEELEARLVRRWRASRRILAEPLRGVSEALDRVGQNPPVAPERLAVAWGVASRPRGGGGEGRVSGDSCLVRALGADRMVVALSDGMGVGVAAAVESEPTVRLADRLLASGFGLRTVAETVNALMVLEGGEDTYATLDVALLDLVTGEAEFVKIGAPPTLLVRRGRVDRVEGHAPPSGVVHDLRVDVRRRRLGAGDWLVALTDGAYEPLMRDREWLEGFLRGVDRVRGPQWVADQLVARAAEVAGEGMDDATVAVVRLGP